MDTILVLGTIAGSLVEATTIKADHLHSCLLIFLHVLLHLWEPVITIVIVTVIGITEAKGGTITEDQILLVVGGGEIPNMSVGPILN